MKIFLKSESEVTIDSVIVLSIDLLSSLTFIKLMTSSFAFDLDTENWK